MAGEITDPDGLGVSLAERLLKQGGREILEDVYGKIT
jgi:hypothetical protein